MSASPHPPIVRTRFAPSPSGHLHVGGARTALFCWAFAHQNRGKFILRIEDTDQKRSSDAASVGFLRDLKWLGINWDEGPEFEDCGGGDYGPYFQSQRLEIYTKYLDQLVAEGKAYYAFDTAAELDAKRVEARKENQNYRYDRAGLMLPPEDVESRLKAGEPAVIRFKLPEQPIVIRDEILGEATIAPEQLDDFVIRKADGYPTYHFAVVVDDELMQVTHVLRAQEHFMNTARHMVLQDALGFRRPVYAHLPLIFNPDGSKMSKRDKDKALRAAVREKGIDDLSAEFRRTAGIDEWLKDKDRQLEFDSAMMLADELDVSLPEINVDDFRRSGYLPEVLCNYLALLGWNPGGDIEKFDRDFLIEKLSFERVLKSPARFDRAKLLSFNHDAIQALSTQQFVDLFRAHCNEFHTEFLEKLPPEHFDLLAAANHKRSKTLDDQVRSSRFFIESDDAIEYDPADKNARKAMLGGEMPGRAHLENLLPILEEQDDWEVPSLERTIGAYVQQHAGGNLGKVAQPLRVAVTGTTISPAIYETLAILGRVSTVNRIRRCLEAFAGA
ncbi:MAG: glutamate--tRNA ligase [Phycisphaerales bacterium]|nr:glutamate--tRNA ligase [Phycisphaerales bacterium]